MSTLQSTHPAGHSRREPMHAALRDLFDRSQMNDRISFDDDTRIFTGTVS